MKVHVKCYNTCRNTLYILEVFFPLVIQNILIMTHQIGISCKGLASIHGLHVYCDHFQFYESSQHLKKITVSSPKTLNVPFIVFFPRKKMNHHHHHHHQLLFLCARLSACVCKWKQMWGEDRDRQIEMKRVETARLLIVRLRVRPDACPSSCALSLSSGNLPHHKSQTHHCSYTHNHTYTKSDSETLTLVFVWEQCVFSLRSSFLSSHMSFCLLLRYNNQKCV